MAQTIILIQQSFSYLHNLIQKESWYHHELHELQAAC